MATSSKRFGLEVKGDLELELRLRRIESQLERLIGASDLAGSEFTQRVSTVPTVTGLRVIGRTPGSVTVAWNQLRLSDLRRYELEIAGNLAFTSNKQTFNVAGTEFQFSTVAIEGGGGGATVYARVRARVNNGNVGQFSAVLNATTGQAQTDDIADEAVTEDKTEGNLPPALGISDALQFLRVNAAGSALEYAYELPATPEASKALIGDGVNVAQTAFTFPASLNNNRPLIGSSGNVEQTSWTVPTTLTNSAPFIGVGGNLDQASYTIPSSLTNVGRILRVSSSNVLSATSYALPSAATADSVLVGDGTDFTLQSQNPSDAAASNTSHSNRSGTLTLAGGFQLSWDTIDVNSGSPLTVGSLENPRSVMVCCGEDIAPADSSLRAYISNSGDPGSITIEQDTGATLEITYWLIEEP